MRDWSEDYQNPELIRISEQIFREKEHKKELEIALSELKLKHQYTYVQKSNLVYKLLIQFLILAGTFLLAINCLDNVFAIWLGLCLLLFDIYLLVKEIRTIALLLLNCDVKIISDIVLRYDINTILKERKNVEKQMQAIRLQIDEINTRLAELIIQKDDCTKAQKDKNNLLKESNISPDNRLGSTLSLKESGITDSAGGDSYEHYMLEKRYLKERLVEITEKLQEVDKEKFQLEEEFEKVKKKILFFAIIFIFAVLIQNLFDGTALWILNIICFLVFGFIIIYFNKTYKNTILMYLIETESNLTKEYAFVNNIIPIKARKIDLLEEKRQCEKEIAELTKETARISFD